MCLCASLALSVLPSRAAQLRAGAAAVDVTPRVFPIPMPGGFTAKYAESAHDPLHARAIVLDDGSVTLAFVVVDNLGVARETDDDAKALAFQNCGIPVDRILIGSTHSHSAAPSNSTSGNVAAVAYRPVLVQGIAEAITRAHAALQPAAVGAATQPLPGEVFNRRWFLKPGKMPLNPFGELDKVKMNPGTSPDVIDRPAGPTDPDVTILSVTDPRGRKAIALLANYSLHYVGGTTGDSISADYYGEFARLMPSRVNGDDTFVAMMSNGTSGDINNIPFTVTRPPREPFEQMRIVASEAADAAWFARRKIEKHQPDATLAMVQREIGLRLRKPSPEEISRAKAVIATKDPDELAKLPKLAENYARRTLGMAGAGDSVNIILQAARVGDLAICAIPFETFAEIGLELKQRSPFATTMVISLANGSNGYLPTPRQHELGGYETWLGTNRVQVDASDIIIKNLLEMLAELH